MRFSGNSLAQWTDYIEAQHPSTIELGLDRMSVVATRLALPATKGTATGKVILVAGSNGKGTSIAILEQFSLLQKCSTFSYTSPHIHSFNERIRYMGKPVEDLLLIKAFNAVENARFFSVKLNQDQKTAEFEETPLTFFEFTTLAAMWIEDYFKPEISLYEVGLGGRLDATNILQPDACLISSISLDHTDWLGETIDEIAYEKVSIARKDTPIVFGDFDFPDKAYQQVEELKANLYKIGKHFSIQALKSHEKTSKANLFKYCLCRTTQNNEELTFDCPTSVHPYNLASACFISQQFLNFKIDSAMVEKASKQLFLPGRFQAMPQFGQVYLDVSHNLQAIEELQKRILTLKQPVRLVCGMLKDKIKTNILAPLDKLHVDWYLADLPSSRGATSTELNQLLTRGTMVSCYPSIEKALDSALEDGNGWGSIVVFGSFITVELAEKYLARRRKI